MEKKCSKCNVVKDISEFSKRKDAKDGLRGYCRLCEKENKKVYARVNKLKIKQYREANKENLAKKSKEYREANKENLAKKRKEYRESKITPQQITDRLEALKKRELLIEGKKKCNKCSVVKDIIEFSKINKNGIFSYCKLCRRESSIKYRELNKEKIKKYLDDNKEKIAKRSKKYKEANKDEITKYNKKYYDDNKEYFQEKGIK